MADNFKLTWHTFQIHTNDLLSELYHSSIYSDVTLVSDDVYESGDRVVNRFSRTI